MAKRAQTDAAEDDFAVAGPSPAQSTTPAPALGSLVPDVEVESVPQVDGFGTERDAQGNIPIVDSVAGMTHDEFLDIARAQTAHAAEHRIRAIAREHPEVAQLLDRYEAATKKGK